MCVCVAYVIEGQAGRSFTSVGNGLGVGNHCTSARQKVVGGGGEKEKNVRPPLFTLTFA